MATTIPRGQVRGIDLIEVALTPTQVAANTTAEQTFTVMGVSLTRHHVAFVNKPTAQAGLGIAGTRVSANNVVAITFVNATASPITPTAAEVYSIVVMTPETLPIPSALA